MSSITENKRSTNQGTVLQNGALGMILFVATEIMFFSGLISSFVVNAADNVGAWPPKWQPRLPVYATAFNTILLLISAVTMVMAWNGVKSKKSDGLKKVSRNLMITMVLGGAFVLLQGVEWVRLLSAGLTTSSSLFGAFFYVIIGAHGLHAVIGLLYLFVVSIKIMKSTMLEEKHRMMTTLSIYWLFVVLLWPVLYLLVYVLPSRG